MKKLIILSSLILYFLLTGFGTDTWYYQYEPIFMYRSEMENSVKMEAPRAIENPGKIYIKENLIFINEKYLGIHIIDNTNPEEPENFAFIHVDGCIDMAMKDNVLYADNAVDLISISVNQNVTGIEVTSRIKNVFPEINAPNGRNLTDEEKRARPKNSILVRWKQK
jgi:hypothetical protein